MRLITIFFLLAVCLVGATIAADVYPNQPKLNNAHNHLMKARKHLDLVDVSGRTPAPKLLDNVVVSLNAARFNLDEAAKNKGSHRDAAIKHIDTAKELIEKLRKGNGTVSDLVTEISAAVSDVKEAAKAGRN